MALESATYIGGLNTANPLSTDTVAQADDHIRLIKAVLKNTFPNLNGPVNLSAGDLTSQVPAGLICMWRGITAPTGWALCDGTNGTPDLRDKFIVGASTTYAIGTSGGGTTTSSSGAHTHAVNASGVHNHAGVTGGTALTYAQIPPHTHTLQGGTNVESGGEYSITTGSGTSTGNAQVHSHHVTDDGEHTHTTVSAGSHTHTLTPPYYALAYIMKL